MRKSMEAGMPEENADKQTDDTATSGEDSAPQDKTVLDAGKEDGSQVGDGDKKSSGVLRDITKLREDRRQLRGENSSLKEELSEIKKLLTQNQGGSEQKSDKNVDAAEMDKRLLELLDKRDNELSRASKSSQANEMFKGLRWVQEDDSFADEVQDSMHRDYGDMVDDNPVRALRLAYDDVCKSRGVSPERIDNSAARASGGAGSSKTPGSGPTVDANSYKQIRENTDWSDPEQRALAKRKLQALEDASK